MGKVLVIAGLLPQDSGKTYFTISLAKGLRSRGYKVEVMKPVAAHSAWFQHESLTESVALGVLIGEDILNYMREGLIKNVDMQNPVDILTAPPDLINVPTLSTYLSITSSSISQAVLARISLMRRNYFIVKDNLYRTSRLLKSQLMSAVKSFGSYREVSSGWLLNRLTSREIGSYILDLAKSLSDRSDYLLVESFNDALIPSFSLAKAVDSIAVVAPGRALVYGVNKIYAYLRAAISSTRLLSKDLVGLLKPDAYIELMPTDALGGVLSREGIEKLLEIME